MYSSKFTVIFHLLVTILVINCVASASQDVSSGSRASEVDDGKFTGVNVATTPKIDAKQQSAFRSEEGYNSDEDDDDDVEDMPEQQTTSVQGQQLSDSSNPLLQIFNAVTNALMKSAARDVSKTTARLIGLERNEELNGDNGGVNDDVTENANDGGNKTERAVEKGRYIQGDPLNGYYDFIITEGSYKFWVVFQLATAALLIYSTLAAIYYSKVNPLTSDYDYVDYLSRSFHGRAISEDSADVEDETSIESGRTYLSSLADNNWVRYAAYGFQFAMDAIDKVPK